MAFSSPSYEDATKTKVERNEKAMAYVAGSKHQSERKEATMNHDANYAADTIVTVQRTNVNKDFLRYAQKYASLGWYVFPLHSVVNGKCTCGKAVDCQHPGKHPRWDAETLRNGRKDATTDLELIRHWWNKWPIANIGILTGEKSGIIVLDVDVKGDGYGSLRELVEKYGALPKTVTAITGSGGRHYYFKHPGFFVQQKVRFADGLDLLADGSNIIAPPSKHISGGQYQWVDGLSPWDLEPAEAPEWLLELIQKENNKYTFQANQEKTGRVWWKYVKGAVIPEGSRNTTLFRKVASSMRGKGASYEDILATLIEINERRVEPKLELSELQDIAKSASKYPEGKQPENRSLLEYPDTDMGNAERLVDRHGVDLKYCVEMEVWLVWDGTRWVKDDHYEVYRRAMETVRAFRQEAEEQLAKVEAEMDTMNKNSAPPNEISALKKKVEAAKKRVQFARNSEMRPRIEAMVNLAKTLQGVPISVNELDQDKYLINLQNGTYDLKTDTFRDHRREDLITKMANVAYDPTAKAERWSQFVHEIMNEDPEMVEYLQRLSGLTLSGDTSEEYMFIPYGTGGNGKSKFLGALLHVLGDYGMQASSGLLLSNRQNPGQANPELVRIRGSRLVVTTESGDGKRLDEELVKLLTGNDWITTRDLYQKPISFRPEAKFFLATNHKPLISGSDNGIWRRVLLIPFEVTFEGNRKDKHLEEKLQSEANGIFLWMLEGFRKWKKDGVNPPEKVVMATAEYRAEMDALGQFINDCCVLFDTAKVKVRELYHAYVNWCDETGETPMNQRMFGKRLKERGFTQAKSTGGYMYWLGVGLSATDYENRPSQERGTHQDWKALQEVATTWENDGWVEGEL